MNMGTISYWFYEAFESMKKNIKNVIISISTMFATMLIIAIGYVVLMNASYIIKQKQEASSKIMAYLDLDVTEEQISNIKETLSGMEGVVEAKYISQEEAIESMAKLKDVLVKGYDQEALNEIYQPLFKITFSTIESEKEIIRTLKTLDGVGKGTDDIQISESAEKSIREAKSAQIISITAMVLLVELSVFLMINTTKLMLYARRKEISIMKYVGAKDGFIKMPFAIEGIIMALIAVVLVFILIGFAYEPIINTIGARKSYNYLKLNEFMPGLRIMLVLIAVFIGSIGSTVSMNKYLDV